MKGITKSNAHGRSNLDEHMFFRILQGIEYLLGIILFDNSTRRADNAALSAEDTVGILQGFVVGGCYDNVITAPGVGQSCNALYIFAGADAAAAFDAFGWIAYDAWVLSRSLDDA